MLLIHCSHQSDNRQGSGSVNWCRNLLNVVGAKSFTALARKTFFFSLEGRLFSNQTSGLSSLGDTQEVSWFAGMLGVRINGFNNIYIYIIYVYYTVCIKIDLSWFNMAWINIECPKKSSGAAVAHVFVQFEHPLQIVQPWALHLPSRRPHLSLLWSPRPETGRDGLPLFQRKQDASFL